MEYWRTPNNQIQAAFAHRIGLIALQYDQLVMDDLVTKYESTLNICLIQSLVTQCVELLKEMKKNERRPSYLTLTLPDTEPQRGLSASMIKINTFDGEDVTYNTVFWHIRDVLSHPTSIDINSPYPSTGFTTPGGPGRIYEYIFVHSPDVRRDRPKFYDAREQAEKALREIGSPPRVHSQDVDKDGQTRYQLWRDGEPFVRIFRIDIPSNNLKQLVQGLSNYLAQPTQEIWDGVTINDLVCV